MTSSPLPNIEIEGLSLYYGTKAAFADVDLTVRAGAITALIGPSGCGKTSLLQSLNRLTELIPGCRVEGRIRIGGRDINGTTPAIELRRRVGMIFQKPNPFPVSIRKNIELPLKDHGVGGRRTRAAIVRRVLEEVGLWGEVSDRLDTPATELSGGQQQRLCIARAVALEPEVLLFDEPCSSLDPISSGTVEDLIAGLRGRFTVVIVTHNLAQARRIADDVAFFWVKDNAGGIVEAGPCRELFESPKEEATKAYVMGDRG